MISLHGIVVLCAAMLKYSYKRGLLKKLTRAHVDGCLKLLQAGNVCNTAVGQCKDSDSTLGLDVLLPCGCHILFAIIRPLADVKAFASCGTDLRPAFRMLPADPTMAFIKTASHPKRYNTDLTRI